MPATPVDLRFEHHTDPAPVVGCRAPRLSWVVPDAEPGYRQHGYAVRLTRGDGSTREIEVAGADQVLVPWPDRPLAARERVRVAVRVRGEVWSPWSEPATVAAGLLDPADWVARLVSPRTLGGLDAPAPVLRGELTVPGAVADARLYITAHGIYRAELNGRRVGDHVLAPGWTSYPHRLRYQAFDVTELVRPGGNVLEALLGNGWYRGRLGFKGGRALYGDRLALLAQLEVTTVDGHRHVLATDGAWTARQSGVLADDLYDGQRTDARHRHAGPPDPVDVLDTDLTRLVAADGPPVRVTGTIPAARVFTAPSGATLVDFGQNLVGWVLLRVRDGEPAAEVTVRHAEVLDGGELAVRPLRTARATDSYLLAGGDEVLEPSLTFHGFRYAEITGVSGLRAEDLHAVVIGTDLRRTGHFECSHPLLNRFHDNVVWSARGNFLDVPTDCPQRDERLGWTGDVQVFAPSACFLFDCAGFLGSWLADLAAEQYDDGSVPFVVPDVLRDGHPAAAAWGDAAVLVPWVVHQRTGDLGLLARHLPSMRAWVDCVARLAGPQRLRTGGFQFGDWLDPAAPPEDPFAAAADPDVVATAYLARSAQVVAEAAALLGDDCAPRYAELAAEVRAAFARAYVTGNGRVRSDAPTVYALALVFDLLPTAEQRHQAGERLADLVRANGFHTATGFVGTPLIMDALVGAGQVDVAYRLLLQTGCPSWLYPVTMGATTVWERWDSLLPDGSVNPGEMTSFNHYALGAVADWLHRGMAGLAPAAPGYRALEIRPRPGPGVSWAAARHRTPYGEAAVSWRRDGGELHLELVVPVGSTATVHVPGRSAPQQVEHGRHTWRVPDPLTLSTVPVQPTEA
ncbi:family 78 glycoside hydrolase catalytic domain [Actinophytocola sp.]|uniref:family 78 glycoside hydrolase catalytic domain n=1 Tax=Actinophytocola sp. TaxID=1872138 RepID=UPI002D7E955F|nr:family 78 glycoside hydrolase catalytic domain [Actinophytocola sp.]HET9143376.1 family 78 glycoside hydrolase catalytic domain [Actinophytocola sp.]